MASSLYMNSAAYGTKLRPVRCANCAVKSLPSYSSRKSPRHPLGIWLQRPHPSQERPVTTLDCLSRRQPPSPLVETSASRILHPALPYPSSRYNDASYGQPFSLRSSTKTTGAMLSSPLPLGDRAAKTTLPTSRATRGYHCISLHQSWRT